MRKQHKTTRLLTGLATMVAAMSLPLGAAIAAPATDTAPQAPAQSDQSKTDTAKGADQNQNNKENDPAPAAPAKPGQSPTDGNTGPKAKPGPAAKGADKQTPTKPALSTRDYSCTVGTSTFRQCFPDETFREIVLTQYSPDGNSWPDDHWKDFNDTVVTQSWVDSVTSIDGNYDTQESAHDITGMQIFHNLTSFASGDYDQTGFSEVTDYSPMAHLTKLASVSFNNTADLRANSFESWDSTNMPALTSFHVYWGPFADFSMIKHLTNLTNIYLDRTTLARTNKDPFHNMPDWFPNLQSLVVSNSNYLRKTMDYEPLTAARMPNLRTLDVSKMGTGHPDEQLNEIPDSFTRMTQLTSLNVNHNHLVDVSPLSALTNLRVLDVSQNKVYDLSSLHTLSNLTKLDAYGQYWDSEANPVARPNVTFDLNQAIDNYGHPVQDYGKHAYFHYSSHIGDQYDAYLPDEDVKLDAPHHQITLVDPHATPIADTPSEMQVEGQIRIGEVFVSFSKPLSNQSTGAAIGNFDGHAIQEVRPPQISFDLRGGSVDGQTSLDPVTVISGHTATLPTPSREDADFLGWKVCVTGATNPQGTSCSYQNAHDLDTAKDGAATKGAVTITGTDDVTLYARWSDDPTNNNGGGNNSGSNNGNGGNNNARPSATGDPNKGKGGLAATGASAIAIALIGIASAIAGSTALRRKKANSQQ